MYGDILGSTFEDVHANTNDSTIKTYLDNWYKTNIEDKGLSSYISDTLFCNDRSLASLNTGSGTGEDPTYYRWYYGPWDTAHVQYPKYNCSNLNDRFTVDDEEIGNGDLSYPIGLVTTDEVVLAGAYNSSNHGYYLYTGNSYWSMSPSYFSGSFAYVRFVYSDGDADRNSLVDYSSGVRPTINLKPNSLKSGDGTMSNPYHVN